MLADSLLCLPEEITRLIIVDFRVKDIVSLRLASRILKEFGDKLMPQYARLKLRGHVGDKRLQDDWAAEKLLAAHVLNVKNDACLAIWKNPPPPHSPSMLGGANDQSQAEGTSAQGAAIQPSINLEATRETQRIASRQELYRYKVKPKKWPFGFCSDCHEGCCL